MQLVLDLPETVFSSLRVSPAEYLDEMRRAAAVKWYEMRRISQGKAAEMCGVWGGICGNSDGCSIPKLSQSGLDCLNLARVVAACDAQEA